MSRWQVTHCDHAVPRLHYELVEQIDVCPLSIYAEVAHGAVTVAKHPGARRGERAWCAGRLDDRRNHTIQKAVERRTGGARGRSACPGRDDAVDTLCITRVLGLSADCR